MNRQLKRSVGRRSATGSRGAARLARLAINHEIPFTKLGDCRLCCRNGGWFNSKRYMTHGFQTFQLEEETKKSVQAQRRHQEEALAAAAAEAARMTELAAAASARAAAADAVQEAVEAAEQDEFKRKAQKLKVRHSCESWCCCWFSC